MEVLQELFDAIDARVPVDDWAGLELDIRGLMRCECVSYYTVKLPPEIPRKYKILMEYPAGVMQDYFDNEIYRHQIVDEDDLPGFAPFRLSDIIDSQLFYSNPHYQNWGRHYGWFYMLFAPLLLSSFELLVFGIGRSDGGEDFDNQDSYRIGLAARYLRRFVQAKKLFDPIDTADLTSKFAIPVATICDSTILSSNIHFRDWCQSTGLFEIGEREGARLRYNDAALGQKITRAMDDLSNQSIEPSSPPKSQISLNISKEGTPQFGLQIMPLVDDRCSTAESFVWFVHRTNPNRAVIEMGVKVGLTPAEIEVFSQIARGISVRSVADITGRSYQTTRWHIQNILSKCGVQSQRELLYQLFNEIER